LISLIVAAAENGVIGRQGELPWRLSDDLRRFKAITMAKPVVMGRKTWESIGRPLPGRHNIVITRQPGYAAEGCDVVSSVDAAIAACANADEIMIIGGSEIYRLFLGRAGRIYLTRVHADIDGDAVFALPDAADWRLVSDERHAADDRNEFDYSFRRYDRVVDQAVQEAPCEQSQ
jgi:dihydrofolate reductase